jgi:hypothetical protein
MLAHILYYAIGNELAAVWCKENTKRYVLTAKDNDAKDYCYGYYAQ